MSSKTAWDPEAARQWVLSQQWYQTIKVSENLQTRGSTDSLARLKLLDLPDLKGKTVLDIGCNSGMYSFECKRRNASRVVGVDINEHRLSQARTLAEIMNLDVEFKEISIYDASLLGSFDVILCFSVLTEISDLIRGLSVIKNVTKECAYVELALAQGLYAKTNFWEGRFWFEPRQGLCELRKTKNGWSLVPDMDFLRSLVGDKFKVVKIGKSVRYSLVRLSRKKPENQKS